MSHRKPQTGDAASFREAVTGTRPLKQDRKEPHRSKRRPVPEQRLRDEREVVASLLSDDFEPAEIETGEELLFARPGLQLGVMRKLRRGYFVVEAELDLHGWTVPEAREGVSEFLRAACTAGKRCVRIIHGKGNSSAGKMPVLKGKVNAWLRRKNEVLAFCSCRPTDGGTGAVYVLLRRGN
jgi:DNA-nicking Smr family endonuclease